MVLLALESKDQIGDVIDPGRSRIQGQDRP